MPQGRGKVELFKSIRLMMAEQRYIEAQQLVEQTMLMHKSDQLLGLYIEIHQLQDSLLPYSETVAFVKTIQEQDPHRSLDLLFKLKAKTIEVKLLEMNLYARLGALDELYKSISNFYLHLYERKIPRVFVEVQNLRRKFFTKDFKLELQEIALELTTILPGQYITGAFEFVTIKVNPQVAVFEEASVAI